MVRFFRVFYIEIIIIAVLVFLLYFLSNGLTWIVNLLDFTRELNPFDSKQLHTISTLFLSIFIEGLPFILIGILVSSLIHVFLTEEKVMRLIPRQPLIAVPMAAFVGLLLPVCECGIVPVAKRLVQKGLPIHVMTTFLLAVPVINPITIVSTYVAFGNQWEMVTLRLLFAAGIAITLGFLSILFFGRFPVQQLLKESTQPAVCEKESSNMKTVAKLDSPAEKEKVSVTDCCCSNVDHQQEKITSKKVMHSLYHAVFEMMNTGKYFILGALIAAMFQTWFGLSAIRNFSNNEFLSVWVIMGLAFGLSVCSTADAFLASTFRTVLGNAPIVAFLVYGPMMDLKNLLMMAGSFRRSVTLFFFIGTTLLTAVSVWLFL